MPLFHLSSTWPDGSSKVLRFLAFMGWCLHREFSTMRMPLLQVLLLLLTCARVLLSNTIRNLTSQLFPELALQYSDNLTMQIDIIETKWNSSAWHGWIRWCQLPGKPIKYPYPTELHFTRHPPPMNITVMIRTNIVFKYPRKTSEITERNFAQWLEQWLQQAAAFFPTRAANKHAKNYILKQLGLFPGIESYNCLLSFEDPVPKHHSWQPSCAIHKYHYLFHSIPTSTPIRTFSHRLKSTWNRILNETDNATWLLGHLELWGIFLFNTSMLFYLSCSADEHWFLWPTAHLNAVMLLSSSCFQFSICNQTLSPTQAKTRTSSSGPRTSMYVRGPLLLVPKKWVLSVNVMLATVEGSPRLYPCLNGRG